MSDIDIVSILTYVLAVALGFFINYFINKLKISKANVSAAKIIDEATVKADNLVKEAILDAKTEAYELKLQAEKEAKQQRQEINELENKLLQREQTIDRRDIAVQGREDVLAQKVVQIEKKEAELGKLEAELKEKINAKVGELEKIAAMSANEAKQELFRQVEQQIATEMTAYIKEQEEEARSKASLISRDIIANAINRYSQEETVERTVSVVALPSEEMKGRIIGREGRNVRTIESVTGVDLIIDDTPEAIVISSFDPLRREIAKLTLDALIKDGRIHPGRIEEVYDKMCSDVNAKIREYGKDAVYSLGISKMDSELVELVGRLHFRSSYGQNALKHSIEVANISGLLASELGENVLLAKRAGLLHDIGKSIDYEMEGSHVQIGVDLAKKYGEDEVIINSIASHHGDVEATSVISSIVAIADTISASRPGARNDSTENYFQRLEQLEEIGNSFEGVDKTFAVQAGRELRVMVKPDEIDDLSSYQIAREIKEKIEEEMQYPGTIKVTVIREVRATEEAK